MDKQIIKNKRKDRRKARIRSVISGTADCPRLAVSKSNTSIYTQIIDDVAEKTLVSAHSREVKLGKNAEGQCAKEFELGKILAEKAKKAKIEKVVFDRGGNLYHGRVKAVAEGAREGGLKF